MLQPTTAAIDAAGEEQMSGKSIDPSMLSAEGQLLVFAPPIFIGFLGAPLSLADAQPRRRKGNQGRKNWAKRRAY
jgi:hypothetical protein